MTNKLLITEEMKHNAKSNKSVGMIIIHPKDFLKLTVSGDLDQWIEEEKEYTKSLNEYNEFAETGKSILAPWLDIQLGTGKVVGHEGRHRAMAVLAAKGVEFPRFIVLRTKHGYIEYYREDRPLDGPWKKTFLGLKDIPKVWTGQFNTNAKVRPDLSTFKGFYDVK